MYPATCMHTGFFFFLAMATTDHGPNKYINKNKQTKQNNFIKHNNNNNNYNNYNIYNLLLKTAANNINTLLYTTLKALSLSNLPTQHIPSTSLPHHHTQQPNTTTTPTANNNPINNKPPLPPPPPNLRWRTMHFRTSRLLIPSISPYYINPTLIYRKEKSKKKNPPPSSSQVPPSSTTQQLYN